MQTQNIITFAKKHLLGHQIDIFGKEDLLAHTAPFYFSLLISVLYYELIWEHAWFATFLIYILVPLCDQVFKLDEKNPTEEQRKKLEKEDFLFQLCLFIPVIYDWFMFFRALNYMAHLEWTPWNTYNFPAFLLMFSNLQGIQMVIAHEIQHKPGKINRVIGAFHQIKNLYMHFTYEHLYGHHRKVATPEDPASAPKGMNVYHFAVKSFLGSYRSVYLMEKNEQKKGFWTNYAVLSIIANILFVFGVFWKYNLQATIIFLLSAYMGIFFVEAVNYMEHYGLRRKRLPNGEYQKVTIRHSWNAPHRFTNYLLFKLQRHSDHHENSSKPYQTLLTLDQSPQLPHGYGLMVMSSFFPSIWFRLMDPLVDNYTNTDDKEERAEAMKRADGELKQFWMKMAAVMFFFWSLTWFK